MIVKKFDNPTTIYIVGCWSSGKNDIKINDDFTHFHVLRTADDHQEAKLLECDGYVNILTEDELHLIFNKHSLTLGDYVKIENFSGEVKLEAFAQDMSSPSDQIDFYEINQEFDLSKQLFGQVENEEDYFFEVFVVVDTDQKLEIQSTENLESYRK